MHTTRTGHDSTRRADLAVLEDAVAAMLWPRLLRATALSLRPARLGIALVMIVLVGLIGRAPTLWLPAGDAGPMHLAGQLAAESGSHLAQGVVGLDHVGVSRGVHGLFVALPIQVGRTYPWSCLAIVVPILLVWAVGGGALARSAATEFSLRDRMTWTGALSFGVSRWGSLLAAKVWPLALAGVLLLGLAAAGWALLQVPFLQVIGAVLYILALLAGSAAVLLLVGYLAGMPMLVPALACEGTDAIDAAQRSYAYVVARPLRVALYLLVLLVQVVVVTLVLAAIAAAITNVTAWSTTVLTGKDVGEALRLSAMTGEGAAEGAGWSMRATGSIIAFWSKAPALLVAAFVVSFWFSGGTVLYLLVRQLCDGQDVGELWQPGRVGEPHRPKIAEEAAPAGDEDDEE